MKQQIFLSMVLLAPISLAYADTPVAADSQQVCENRINAFKSALQTAIDKKQNPDEAREKLDQINKLPDTLSPCEKQKRISEILNEDASKSTTKSLKDREISPQ